MLQINPVDRPDIKTILNHPYFNQDISEYWDIANPFTSPLGTPEREDTHYTQNPFAEPAFGRSSNMPSFGNQDYFESEYKMETSNSDVSNSQQKYRNKAKFTEGDYYPGEVKSKRSPEKKMAVSQSRFAYSNSVLLLNLPVVKEFT